MDDFGLGDIVKRPIESCALKADVQDRINFVLSINVAYFFESLYLKESQFLRFYSICCRFMNGYGTLVE